jgi:DHA2 family methylenomycin A resistance protein-like MFS transporter
VRRSPATDSPRAALVVMCVGYFLVLLDVTVVNVALPDIRADLGAGVGTLQGVVDGYAVALACLMLAAGTVGDLYGHRRLVLTGLGLFGVGSLACAVAASEAWLVVARVGQGVGAALLLPATLAIITRAYPAERERARAIGVWAAVGSTALPAGPLLGGLLVGALGWRAVFVLNLPVIAVAVPAVLCFVERDRGADEGRLDLAGIGLGALALTAFTVAVIEAGRRGLESPLAAGGLAVALLAGFPFIAAEGRAARPMLPLGLFRRPRFAAANAVAGSMNLGTLGMLFVFTLYLQSVQGHSPLVAGVALVPLFAPLAVLAPVAGRLAGARGPRFPMIVGLLLAAVGLLVAATLEPDSPYGVELAAMLLWGGGLGFLTPAVVAAAVGALPTRRAGLASAVNNTARQAGGAIGIAICGAIAGNPDGSHFMSGLHTVAVGVAVLWLAAAVATAVAIPGRALRAVPPS